MHSIFQSPFSQRYGSTAMRELWSEQTKRRLWRQLWVTLAEAQLQLGIVNAAQVDDLRAHADDVTDASIARALEIEREIHHDLMAEVHAFAEQCPIGGGIIHLGATSMDIEDNAEAMRLREALTLTLRGLESLISALTAQVERYADLTTMAFTHLQPAEPTTLGYRLAQYLQDLLVDLDELRRCRDQIKGKGFRGAVGTSASYLELCDRDAAHFADFNRLLNQASPIDQFEAVTQTYPRKQDLLVVNGLAGVSQSLYKFAFDLRVLQSPPIGELAEPFASKQVGSSAMPFKRNPINAEKIDSLARFVATLPRVMWDNAAHSLLERTLDDSANRRAVLPEAFLAVDEMLRVATRIVRDLRVNEPQIARNMATYGPFAATERLLMAAVKAGGDRQHLHGGIRTHSMQAWAAINAGQANPLAESLCGDAEIVRLLPADQARALLDASAYVGDAPARARALAARARAALS
ncbi:MAG: adenylosuccinate lyase [Anaerolineae bacterium]|nr:adenylosuccinate lyase [Anaerolineae bacterium]